ncbi:MAG: MFS transporter [Rhodospirillales bacterium]|nr:MFS transporter [Rhodospirillales bacterium]
MATVARVPVSGVESSYAWRRLAVAVVLSTIGGVGMWSVVLMLPSLEKEFGVTRAEAALPYTLTMLGVMVGGVVMGRIADRFGVMAATLAGTFALAFGYVVGGAAETLWQVALVHGLFMGFLGSSASFAPVIADISHWFDRRRGLAVAIAACGSYLAGTIWPPVVQRLIDSFGWRQSYFFIGLFCLATMLPLSLLLRRRPPAQEGAASAAEAARHSGETLGIPPNLLQALLMVAGVACCVAMAMPQVHIVAYCGDLGYGAARGAEMLSLMLGFGVVSRLASGWITDRIGPLATLLLGSVLQAVSLVLYLPFDGLASLYVVSSLFGLFQGGIVPSYAVIVRQYFPARETGLRVGLVLSATLAGMALGGWMSGAIFDWTGSYRTAFLNGIAWNVLNAAIAAWLLWRSLQTRTSRPALAA